MAILYKLTDKNDQTRGGCQWGENVSHTTDGSGELCGPGFTHWYTHPLLAVLFNMLHGRYDLSTAHLWEGEGEVVKTNYGLKVGCTTARTIRRIPIPEVSITQKKAFYVLAKMQLKQSEAWLSWMTAWLEDKNRSTRRKTPCSAATAAFGAAQAIRTAHEAGIKIDLIALAKRAMEIT